MIINVAKDFRPNQQKYTLEEERKNGADFRAFLLACVSITQGMSIRVELNGELKGNPWLKAAFSGLYPIEHRLEIVCRTLEVVTEAKSYLHDQTPTESLVIESSTLPISSSDPRFLPAHPQQPTYIDAQGVTRYRGNSIVQYFGTIGSMTPALRSAFSNKEDRLHFAQLLGVTLDEYRSLPGAQ